MKRRLRAALKALTSEPVTPHVAATESWKSPLRRGRDYSTTLTVDYDETNTVKVTREAFTAVLADAGYRRLT